MENNIFDQVGKKMPYRVPEGYFEQPKKMLRPLRRKWFYAIAAGVALLVGVFALTRLVVLPASDADTVLYSDEYSADEWSDFADADIFLDNLDW